MPESYFEEATVTIKDVIGSRKFLRTKPYSGPAKIKFLKVKDGNDTVLVTKDVNVTKGKLDAPLTETMPVVEKTEPFYAFRVDCEYKGSAQQMLDGTIWPKKTKVLVVDKDNNPKSGFAILVKQKGIPDQTLNTVGDGTSAVTLKLRGPYSIVPAGQFRILSDEQVTAGELRDHKLSVDTTIIARFDSPDVTKAPFEDDPDVASAKKQYVNLPSKEWPQTEGCGCDAKGSNVTFTVTADPPELGRAGDKVYFEVTFGRESKRNKPAPVLGNSSSVSGKKTSGNKITGYVVLASDNGTFKAAFDVQLGIAGGDTCEVKIGGTAEVNDAKLKLVNWRKIYAQVTKTAALTSPSLAPAVECFKKVNIGFEESATDEVIVAGGDIPAGSVVSGTVIEPGAPVQSLVIGDHNVSSFSGKLKSRFKSNNLPVAHLIYCDFQLDADAKSYSGSTVVPGKTTTQAQGTATFPGGTVRVGVKIPSTDAGGDALFFKKDLKDGSEAMKECKWSEVGGTGSGTIGAADYEYETTTSGETFLYIRLPAAAKTLSDNGKDIEIDYKLAYADGWYNGWCTSAGRHNVIKVGRPDQDICGTIVHEVGHAIQQAANNKASFPGLKAPPHGRYYTNNRGHLGPHCADGLSDTDYKDKSLRMTSQKAQTTCTCIMFGAGTTKRNATLAFCDKCAEYVKAVEITAVSG